MKMTSQSKFQELKKNLKSIGKISVALSGGIDSSLLLYAAAEVCAEVVAVTAVSNIRHKSEYVRADKVAGKAGAEHIIIRMDELKLPEIRMNRKDRCYYCKKMIFTCILDIVQEKGIEIVAEGSTCDDKNVFRPGGKAIKELGIISPLAEAGFSKRDVLNVMDTLDDEMSGVPEESCLLTRFPYDYEITGDKLEMVRSAEDIIVKAGFPMVRVRTYGDIARIEVPGKDIYRLFESRFRGGIMNKLKSLGYRYITVDLEGFRSGSMDL